MVENNRKLIINADGFGFTPGVNKGIMESIERGLVSSISCVVNFPYIKEISKIVKNYSHLSIGIHLNLSVGKPVSNKKEIPSLVSSSSEFYGEEFTKRLLIGKIKFKDIIKELEAQVNLLEQLVPYISHFDGHQNKHLYPSFFLAAISVGKKHNIKKMRCHRRHIFVNNVAHRKKLLLNYYTKNPVRVFSHLYGWILTNLTNSIMGIKTADRLISPAYLDNSKKYFLETWVNIMKTLPKGVSEIYCHPGYPDNILRKYAKYVDERELEVEILTSDALKKAILAYEVEVISFDEL